MHVFVHHKGNKIIYENIQNDAKLFFAMQSLYINIRKSKFSVVKTEFEAINLRT